MQLKIKLKPWTTPNFVVANLPPVRRQDGFNESQGFPLQDVEAETLSELCDVFRAEIFRKAGKEDPAIARPAPAPMPEWNPTHGKMPKS